MPLLTVRTEPEKNFPIIIDGEPTAQSTPSTLTLDAGTHTVMVHIPVPIFPPIPHWRIKEWRDGLGNIIGTEYILTIDLTTDMEVVAILEYYRPIHPVILALILLSAVAGAGTAIYLLAKKRKP